MKFAIINCFDTYHSRVMLLAEYLQKQNHEIQIFTSDFLHSQKKKVINSDIAVDICYLETIPYKKNISCLRMYSHFKFSKDTFTYIENFAPDVIYVMLPPNSLGRYAFKYKKIRPDVKLIVDIIDLWPETMPISAGKNNLLFRKWRDLRNRAVLAADYVITECNLYQNVLSETLTNKKFKTIYWCKKETTALDRSPILQDTKILLCYLGSINNLVDIPEIARIIHILRKSKPVELHVIGDGEQRETFIKRATEAGAKVQFYGKIYDPYEKQQIFNRCHFGLNIMKPSVCVGLTMKSIDYFAGGLPIINSIGGDTETLVKRYGTGINVHQYKNDIGTKYNSVDCQKSMRMNARKVYENLFSMHSFEQSIYDVLTNMDLKCIQ